jgi:hypothetical protein
LMSRRVMHTQGRPNLKPSGPGSTGAALDKSSIVRKPRAPVVVSKVASRRGESAAPS